MMVDGKHKTWPTPMMMEWPFWRDGMTVEEYIEEYDYYEKCEGEGIPPEEYRPLWWQRENNK